MDGIWIKLAQPLKEYGLGLFFYLLRRGRSFQAEPYIGGFSEPFFLLDGKTLPQNYPNFSVSGIRFRPAKI